MDFKRLPEGTKAIDLWKALHDATLESVTSNILARSVTIELGMAFGPDENYPSTDFKLRFEAVKAVRVQTRQNHEPEFVKPSGMSYEEEHGLWKERWSKGRWSSIDWSAFEKEVFSSNRVIYVQYAQLFQSGDGIVMLIGIDDDRYEIVIDAGAFSTTDGTSRSYTLAELLEIGKRSWPEPKQDAEGQK